MEAIANQEHAPIQLKEATVDDIPTLLELEKSVAGTNVYSPTLTESESRKENYYGDGEPRLILAKCATPGFAH